MRLNPNRTTQTIVVLVVVAGLIVLALGGYLTPVTRIAFAPVITAQTWLSSRMTAIQNILTAPEDFGRLRDRNTELEAEVSSLQAEVIALKQQLAETRILSALVDFARINPEYRYVAASVIGRDPSPFFQYVIINRGSDDGLRRGMPVVVQQGLVGRIAATTAGAARVQLITDPASSINVRVDPADAPAVLQGQVTGDLSLEMVPHAAEVQVGDVVVTSGLGGNYPPELITGQVTGIRSQDTELFQRASVKPAADFSQLEIVLVITNFRPIDITPLVPNPGSP